MKKTILTFGGISGLVIGLFIVVISLLVSRYPSLENTYVGYSAQIIALSFIFVGVKNFRDKFNQGAISFGKALKVGLGITLIAGTVYVLVWLVEFYVFIPDFMDKYAAKMVKNVHDSGVPQAIADKKIASINGMKEMYKNPLFVILLTYVEVLPVGIVISLLTALILKRKHPRPEAHAYA
jgi:Protein of unknown function (DUF4199)